MKWKNKKNRIFETEGTVSQGDKSKTTHFPKRGLCSSCRSCFSVTLPLFPFTEPNSDCYSHCPQFSESASSIRLRAARTLLTCPAEKSLHLMTGQKSSFPAISRYCTWMQHALLQLGWCKINPELITAWCPPQASLHFLTSPSDSKGRGIVFPRAYVVLCFPRRYYLAHGITFLSKYQPEALSAASWHDLYSYPWSKAD